MKWNNSVPHVKILYLVDGTFNMYPKACNFLCFSTSSAPICVEDAPRKGGKLKLTPKGNKSGIVNPLFAAIESWSSNGRFKNPLLLTISRSEIELVYSSLVNVPAPPGTGNRY